MKNRYRYEEDITMMNPKKIRVIKARARENLLGKYGPIIGTTLLIYLISGIISACFSPMLEQAGFFQYAVYYVADFIIAMLINFFYAGINVMHLKAGRGEKGTVTDLAFPVKNGTNRFLIVAAVLTVITLIQGIPSVLLTNQFHLDSLLTGNFEALNLQMIFSLSVITIIASIISLILLLDFALAFYFLIDNPDMTAKEALVNSHQYMKGNKLRLFFQYISFVGLYLLGILTAGIAYLWLIPYMDQSVAVFYETLVKPENLNAPNEEAF